MFEPPTQLSRLAFGVAGPHATPLVSKKTTIKLIQAAYSGGVTVFDTGPSYGAGEAERRLGAALSMAPRKSVFISTKAGINEGKNRDFSPGGIRSSLDRSLKRLQCDYVDALFLHGPAASELTDSLAQALQAEKQSGRVRLLGIAGRGAEIDAALRLELFDLLMTPVNRSLSNTSTQRLAIAREAGMGVFGIEVLNGASAGLRWPRSVADFWYCARAIRQNKLAAPTVSAAQALQNALIASQIDVVMFSTTRQSHLQEALQVLDELA